MPGRTPHEAVLAFLDPLRRTLSRFTPSVLSVGGGYFAGAEHVATVNGGLPFALGSAGEVAMVLTMRYRVIEEPQSGAGPWRVETTGYLYSILGPLEAEIVSYHWHPSAAVTWPHIHLGSGAGAVIHPLAAAHLPSGRRVAVEQVLRLCVELGVVPLRDDWEAVLEESLEAFEQWRRW